MKALRLRVAACLAVAFLSAVPCLAEESVRAALTFSEQDKQGRLVVAFTPKLMRGAKVLTSPVAGNGRPFPLPVGPALTLDLFLDVTVSFDAENLRMKKIQPDQDREGAKRPDVEVEYGWDGSNYHSLERDQYNEWHLKLPLDQISASHRILRVRVTAPWRKYRRVFLFTFASDFKATVGDGISMPTVEYDAKISGPPTDYNLALFQELCIGQIITGRYARIGGLIIHFATPELGVATDKARLELEASRRATSGSGQPETQSSDGKEPESKDRQTTDFGTPAPTPTSNAEVAQIDLSALRSWASLREATDEREPGPKTAPVTKLASLSQNSPRPTPSKSEPFTVDYASVPNRVVVIALRPFHLAWGYGRNEIDWEELDLSPGGMGEYVGKKANLDGARLGRHRGLRFIIEYFDEQGNLQTRSFDNTGVVLSPKKEVTRDEK